MPKPGDNPMAYGYAVGIEPSDTTEAECAYCGLASYRERVVGHECPETCPHGDSDCPGPNGAVINQCAACTRKYRPLPTPSRPEWRREATTGGIETCECGYSAPASVMGRHDHTECPNGNAKCDGPRSLRTCAECRRDAATRR